MEGVHVKGLKVFHRPVLGHFRKLFDIVFGRFATLTDARSHFALLIPFCAAASAVPLPARRRSRR
jgi:hypothetical protein